MTNILPIVDWAAEALRPTLLGILRRLDKTFNKIYKKPSIRVSGFKMVYFMILFKRQFYENISHKIQF